MTQPSTLLLPALLAAALTAHAGDKASASAAHPALLLAQAVPAEATDAEEKPARKPDIHFVPTPEELVEEMLRTAQVKKNEVVYDLGCGDGRIVITAAKQYGAQGIGIDIDPARIKEAKANAEKAGVSDRVKFLKADIFTSDFSDANVIALYLLTSINEKLRPKILAETKPGTRIVSHAFSMGPWEADEHKAVNGRNMYYWVVPANLSGSWKGSGKNGGISALDLQQNFQKITGTVEMGGAKRNITEGKVTGEKFTLTLEPQNVGGEPIDISGQIKGEELQASVKGKGDATLVAKRDANTKRSIEGGTGSK